MDDKILKLEWYSFYPDGEEGCWCWSGGKTWDGYGKVRWKGKTYRAHRLSYEAYHQETIPKGKLVLHTCDERTCINPAHLFIGTHKDNMHDMKKKGRQTFGTSNPTSKLTEENVLEIRHRLCKGQTNREIAKVYGVSNSTISQINTRKIWKHVK